MLKLPKDAIEIKFGMCKDGDYVTSTNRAHGVVGETVKACNAMGYVVYRVKKVVKKKVSKK
jgi:hypothetical protein